ncbi:MAG: hypothetical protein Q9159_000207 [Coniocarpon cinnabarinum]
MSHHGENDDYNGVSSRIRNIVHPTLPHVPGVEYLTGEHKTLKDMETNFVSETKYWHEDPASKAVRDAMQKYPKALEETHQIVEMGLGSLEGASKPPPPVPGMENEPEDPDVAAQHKYISNIQFAFITDQGETVHNHTKKTVAIYIQEQDFTKLDIDFARKKNITADKKGLEKHIGRNTYLIFHRLPTGSLSEGICRKQDQEPESKVYDRVMKNYKKIVEIGQMPTDIQKMFKDRVFNSMSGTEIFVHNDFT